MSSINVVIINVIVKNPKYVLADNKIHVISELDKRKARISNIISNFLVCEYDEMIFICLLSRVPS